MARYYINPTGTVAAVYLKMLSAGHTLIAGATGSGKSTVISGLIHTALYTSPATTQFIICDPKRVDMIEYKTIPHAIAYVTEPKQIIGALQYAVSIMESRYKEMTKRRLKEYEGPTVYVVIDELADLMTDPAYKKQFSPLLQRLTQLGRAAHITVIAATQCCLRTIIDTSIKCNFSSRLALRTASAQDSRNIIDTKGAELLQDPRSTGKAYGIWRNGADTNTWALPRYSDEERNRLIEYWRVNRKPRFMFGRKGA